MLRFVVLACLASAAFAQYGVDPKLAKILKEQRFNAGDGRAGSAYATEDGTVFREEIDASGNRIGQYSYVGAGGKTYNVKYIAGKEGFRVLEGDHIRATGQQAAPWVSTPAPPPADLPEPAPLAAPVQQYAPVQQQAYAPAPQQQVQYAPAAPSPAPQLTVDYGDYNDVPTDPNRNPFVNPHDPTHRDWGFNKLGQKYEPSGASSFSFNGFNVPACADCQGVNPFVNPWDNTHDGKPDFRPLPKATPTETVRSSALEPLQYAQAALRPAPQQQQQLAGQYNPYQIAQPAQPAALPALPAQQETATPSPVRYFPPGQLKLNRFENGFNFDFTS